MPRPITAGSLFAVTGRPVLHSVSPQLFQSAFAALNLPHRYLRLAAEDAAEAEALADALGLVAWNVTAPHKDGVAARVRLEGAAKRLGAVNTVVRSGSSWRGLNTDGLGVIGALSASGLALTGRRAVVLGAGGAGRAAACGLVDAGAQVTVVNRSPARAQQTARALGCRAAGLERLPGLLAKAQVLVDCVPGGVGLVEPSWLHPGLCVLEADYAHGRLAGLARAAGCRVVDGKQWLLHQALAGFELMVGQPAPEGAMRAGLQSPAPTPTRIALIGFMGAGKTTLGQALAARLGWGFIDLDAAIVDRAGLGIGQIFERQGERAFRALEKQALEAALGLERTVIACGGGVVLDETNRGWLAGCLCIWMWSSLETCLRRTTASDRPLLAGADRVERAAELLSERTPLYASCASLVVGSDHRKPADLVDRVEDEVGRIQGD